MEFTDSLKNNNDFRRLYKRGKSAVMPNLVVYFRRNGGQRTRLGLTVSNKVGHAVTRNKIRRRLREIYRLHEGMFPRGADIVAVARVKSSRADYKALEADFLSACRALGIIAEEAAEQ